MLGLLLEGIWGGFPSSLSLIGDEEYILQERDTV